jgi:hypothetical protein
MEKIFMISGGANPGEWEFEELGRHVLLMEKAGFVIQNISDLEAHSLTLSQLRPHMLTHERALGLLAVCGGDEERFKRLVDWCTETGQIYGGRRLVDPKTKIARDDTEGRGLLQTAADLGAMGIFFLRSDKEQVAEFYRRLRRRIARGFIMAGEDSEIVLTRLGIPLEDAPSSKVSAIPAGTFMHLYLYMIHSR